MDTTLSPMVPQPFRVRRVRKETHDTFTVELRPADATRALPFSPGQFNMLYMFGVGEVPISISGDPARPALLRSSSVSRCICSGASSTATLTVGSLLNRSTCAWIRAEIRGCVTCSRKASSRGPSGGAANTRCAISRRSGRRCRSAPCVWRTAAWSRAFWSRRTRCLARRIFPASAAGATTSRRPKPAPPRATPRSARTRRARSRCAHA